MDVLADHHLDRLGALAENHDLDDLAALGNAQLDFLVVDGVLGGWVIKYRMRFCIRCNGLLGFFAMDKR